MTLLQQQHQCLKQKKSILIKCSNSETLKTLKPMTLSNSLENVSMKNYKNLVTSTSGSTLLLTKKEQKTLTGSITLLVVILILTFLLLGQQTILKQTREKTLKIFGNENL